MMMTETTKAATTTAIDADTNVKLWNNFSLWIVVVCAIIKRACVCISILCTRISLAYSQKQQLLLQPLKANLVLFYVCIWQWVCVWVCAYVCVCSQSAASPQILDESCSSYRPCWILFVFIRFYYVVICIVLFVFGIFLCANFRLQNDDIGIFRLRHVWRCICVPFFVGVWLFVYVEQCVASVLQVMKL